MERELGQGANGRVFLVSRAGSFYAMKVSDDPVDLQAEANVLKRLSMTDGSFRRFLVDVDDFQENGKRYPFYVMKYVKGVHLQDYLRRKGKDWFPLIGLRLLEKLRELHRKGWIFGDLKRENILVSGYGDVELVDFGGVTPKGRAVKQFTEIHDRGYWDAGSRSADEAYDLFAFAILCLQMCGRKPESFAKHVLPQNRNVGELLDQARNDPECRAYLPFLEKALLGTYTSSEEAYAEWKRLCLTPQRKQSVPVADKKHERRLTAVFAASLILFAAAVMYYR